MHMFLFLFGTYLGMDFLSHLVTAFNGLKNDKAIFQTDPFYFLPAYEGSDFFKTTPVRVLLS